MSQSQLKAHLRTLYRQKRREFQGPARQHAQHKISSYLIQIFTPLIQSNTLQIIAGYDAFDGEVDLSLLYHHLSTQCPHLTLVYPIHSQSKPLQFSTADSWNQKANGFRFPQGQRINLESIDLILTPGVVFGPKGKRIGFGGGYYDRTFCLDAWRGLHFGVGFDFQWVEFQSDPWDIPLEGMLSNQGWYEKSLKLSTFLSI